MDTMNASDTLSVFSSNFHTSFGIH